MKALLIFSIMLYHYVKPNIATPITKEYLNYSIIKDDKTIGNIRVERYLKDDITEYLFESRAKVKILYSIEIYDKMGVTFKQNMLQQAKLYRTMNGKLKVNNTATWNGSFYNLSDKDGANGSLKQSIFSSTASLYFNEPGNLKSVFSEKFQKMIPIQKINSNKYRIDLPNGNTTTYTYSKGVCTLVEANTDFANLKFVLNTSSNKTH
ncbi:DUF6134 family protein [Chryseobacterium vrystaatense]|uniref:Uncharacterized protein n=1 Tax=Chryseobacterium vrystaatense TaxID=307480 RepID=A0A1M5NYZ5_9FLAO|nr:DUF6134 family protein [Chryseobacterium vrystaatense]SHG94718.1 hypothetical protein SAMN02787073_5119 [Chryseobacterium vrystaatense]